MEKWPVYLHGSWQPFQVRDEGYFPGIWKKGTSRHFGELKNLRNIPNHIGIAGKALWQLCPLASLS